MSSSDDKEVKKSNTVFYVLLGIIILVILFFTLMMKIPRSDRETTVVIYEGATQTSVSSTSDSDSEPTESSSTSENVIVFDTTNSNRIYVLDECDKFVGQIFSGSSTSLAVPIELSDKIQSSVAQISPQGGFVARQSSIVYSGLEDVEEGYSYLSIVSVTCMNMNNSSSKFNVVINLSLDEDFTVTDFSMSSFK